MNEETQKNRQTEDEVPPWLEPVPDEASSLDGPDTSRYILAGLATAALLVFAGTIFFLYSQTQAPDEVVTVQAPEGPVKERPDEPGGMDVPHQDKLVYDTVSGDDRQETVTLRDEPEQPMDLPAAVEDKAESAMAEADQTVGSLRQQASQPPQDDTPATGNTPSDAVKPVADPAASASEQAAALEEAVETTARAAEEAELDSALAPTAMVPETSYMIQVGAFSKEATARAYWDDLSAGFPDTLGSLNPLVEALDRSSGTLYRLRGGPLGSEAGARAACAELKAEGRACVVVPPKDGAS